MIILCSGVSSLVELELSNNFLESIPIAALAALDNLKFLNLGSNKIQVKRKREKIAGNFVFPFPLH